jgi:hypothetical protein
LGDQPVEDMRKCLDEYQAVLCRVENMAIEKDNQVHKTKLDAIGHTRMMDVCPYGVLSVTQLS